MDRPDVIDLDLEDVVGKADRDLLVAGLQALCRERVGRGTLRVRLRSAWAGSPCPGNRLGLTRWLACCDASAPGQGPSFDGCFCVCVHSMLEGLLMAHNSKLWRRIRSCHPCALMLST